MQRCRLCGETFDSHPVINGVRLNLNGRHCCLACRPHRPLRRPRKPVAHAVKAKCCESCGNAFPAKLMIEGRIRSLYRRRFCLDCSPFGIHNTSKTPPGSLSADALREHRRKRRNAKTYRYQKRRRRELKDMLVRGRGGRCEDCGYDRHPTALDLHHRDPSTKEFALGSSSASLTRVLAEAEKCTLLCANCHRLRHAYEDASAKGGPVVDFRRRLKARAVAYMGGVCVGCGHDGHQVIFEFHHRDPSQKDFGITSDGIPRRWEKIVTELAKCVMLCANCHREVHAGVRVIEDEVLLGLAESAGSYDRRSQPLHLRRRARVA